MTKSIDRVKGSFTPLVTPFLNGRIDFDAFARLIEFQIDQGSHGLVVTGTTGEPSTLRLEERAQLIEMAVTQVQNRIPVMAATGTNSLFETLSLTEQAVAAGADAILVVTPYFVRPPQRGLVEYFSAVGRASDVPFLIYHIPRRAAVNLEVSTVIDIAEQVPSLVGIKHAAHDLGFVTELLHEIGQDFRIFVGLEELSLPMLAIGACGLMNAVANVVPRRIAALYEAVAQGDLPLARKLHLELFELNKATFWDTNPIPVKYLMRRAGLLSMNEHRLPMVPAGPELERRLDKLWERVGDRRC
jgi:4-hydroxy-tetrahydrodipicolinate synthase